jgi:hypothetical protein
VQIVAGRCPPDGAASFSAWNLSVKKDAEEFQELGAEAV